MIENRKMDKLEQAAQCYINRLNRKEHPEGTFDKAKRFQPSEQESRDCCNHIRRPSARFPYSLMVHCRTIEHIANLYEVDTTELRRLVRAIQKEREHNDNQSAS